MTLLQMVQVTLGMALLIGLSFPLGRWIGWIYRGNSSPSGSWWTLPERILLRLGGVQEGTEQDWKSYALSALTFNGIGLVVFYAILRLQHLLPLNPAVLGPVSPGLALNTALSFITNTNWQSYGGETTLSLFSQMVALTSQNFLSAATGLAVLFALIRGITRKNSKTIGNFWTDMVRSVVYLLLPLSVVGSLFLVAGGVPQTLEASRPAQVLDVGSPPGANPATQTLSLGPVASQVAIKQLGTNGGGFFNVNSAHPFENPTPFTNLLEWLAILLIPAASCLAYGSAVGDKRQGRALLLANCLVVIPLTLLCIAAENHPGAGRMIQGLDLAQMPNLEGKEVRFGVAGSAMWAVATTAASNGSVNAMLDSFTPLGGLIPLWLMQLGEVIFGGVGSGLYGLILYVILAVFISGLLVGRMPEYLGKKVEVFEVKMASLAVLLPAAVLLLGTALAVSLPVGRASTLNPGPQGFSEILYALSSASNNNGSAFAGLSAGGDFWCVLLGFAMVVGRYGVLVPTLALAGSLARKRSTPPSPGTLPTHDLLFVGVLLGTVLLVGALTYLPALALGPLATYLDTPH